MAYDEAMAQILRADLSGDLRVEEKRMFGALCFMLDGHMLCGAHGEGGMFRVGKTRTTQALAIKGVSEMAISGRKMGGLVDVTADLLLDKARRSTLMGLARDNVASLPAR